MNMSRKNKEKQYPLVLQVLHRRCKREIYTPYRLYEEELNVEKEMLRVGRRNKKRPVYLREAQEFVSRLKEVVFDICKKLEAEKGNYTVEDILVAYKSYNDYNNLFIFAEYLSSLLEKEGKYGTSNNYKRAVKAFAGFINDPTFTFNQLTPQLLERYRSYLQRRGNKINTIWFYLYQLRVIYRKAVSVNIVHFHTDPFSGVDMRREKTAKRAIPANRLRLVTSADLSQGNKTVNLARDLFMFSFYTRGMAFVDMCYLKKENIKGDTLFYRRKKTTQLLEMKIESELQELIDKYADPSSPFLLPMLRENDSYKSYRNMQRKLNKGIQKVGEIIGFTFPLTFYVARHSWATMARDEGVSISVISTCLGHASEKTTLIYLGQINQEILDEANSLVLQSWKDDKKGKNNGLLSHKRAKGKTTLCS